MKKAINLKEIEANYLWMLKEENDDALITTQQAARVIGVCLRTMRNWEAKGKAPPREPEGRYPRHYRCATELLFEHRKWVKAKSIPRESAQSYDADSMRDHVGI